MHKWSSHSAAAAVSQFGLRKVKIGPSKDRHVKKICPVENCCMVMIHLGDHLVSAHGKIKESVEYKILLKNAVRYDQSMLPENVTVSPRKIIASRKNNKSTSKIKQDTGKDLVNNKENNSHNKLTIDVEQKSGKDLVNNKENRTCSNRAIEEATSEVSEKKQWEPVDISVGKQPVKYTNETDDSDSFSDDDDDDDEDGDDDDDDDDWNPEDEYIVPNEIGKVLDSFYKYFTGPDRGRKEMSVKTITDDVRRILHSLKITNINELFDENSDLLRKKYLMGICVSRNTKPSSVRKYLYFLKDFCEFLLKNEKLVDVPRQNIKTAKSNIKLAKKLLQ